MKGDKVHWFERPLADAILWAVVLGGSLGLLVTCTLTPGN
jgi:hypothetical protein